MAGSQYMLPQSVSPSTPRRRFTLAQANRTLPLVRRIVSDVVRTQEQITRLEEIAQQMQSDTTMQRALDQEMDLHLRHMEDYVGELADIGCELKDSHMGLIDFVGRHKGKDVYLCWKLGEAQIDYFHSIDKGFAGRTPVTLLEEKE